MIQRAPRNQGLPSGIRLKADGRYEVKGMQAVPRQFVQLKDGSYRPRLVRVYLGRFRSLGDAIRARENFLHSQWRRPQICSVAPDSPLHAPCEPFEEVVS